MNNQRKVIKKRIKAILDAETIYLGIATEKIFINKAIEAVQIDDFPALVINTKRETVRSVQTIAPAREYEIELPVTIDCLLNKSMDIEDDLDDLMDKVITVLTRHELDQFNLQPRAWGDLIYSGSEQVLKSEGDSVIGLGQIEINITYQALAPVIEPDDLDTVGIEYRAKPDSVLITNDIAIASDVVDLTE
jgi:hypothetical protein